MNARLINRRDLAFQLYELLDCASLPERARYAEHSRETFDAVLDTAEQIASELFAPHNREADEHEPQFVDGRVQMIPQVRAALDAFREAGFLSAGQNAELGGMQLPTTIAQAAYAIFDSANVSTMAYPFLTIGNSNVIAHFGSDAQKRRYLPQLLSGRFFGTMALTEPQAGSSLSDLRTRAVPQADGSYRLHGTKIFISGGDHELADNIVHLVLARIDGAPPGVKGISLFIVPKWRVNDDGSLGARNDVKLSGLIHKMGYRGTTSTILSFGDDGNCHAELVGAPHRGLSYMFHMMNEARIGVGLGAVMLGYSGYLHSLAYARDRVQGRPPTGKDPLAAPVRLTAHADIRRMLLAQKSYVEGGLALCLYAARLIDEQMTGTEASAAEAGLLLDLLTPVVKSWPSQWCLEANALAIQVHGGYGYTRDYPVEQCYRDNRLNPIHEGTHGIQSLDLLGRKLWLQGGAPLRTFEGRARQTLEAAAAAGGEAAEQAQALGRALSDVQATLGVLAPALQKDADRALANSAVFLESFGHVVMSWTWLRQTLVAQAALAAGASEADSAFYHGKLAAARYFFRWELPKTRPQFELLRSLDPTCLEMQEAWF